MEAPPRHYSLRLRRPIHLRVLESNVQRACMKLKLSTVDHLQTDGQTENANQIIEQRLRPFMNHHQDDWSEKLPMMDFAGALLVGESTETSPFLIDSSHTPRTSFDWTLNLDGTVTEVNAQQQLQQLQETWDWVQE